MIVTRNAPARAALAAMLPALALAGLALIVGNWRESLLYAAPLPVFAALLRRYHNRAAAPGTSLDAVLVRGCLFYALLALALAGFDQLCQVRLAELLSPLATNPIEGREALKGWLLAHGQAIYPRAEPAYPRLITLYPPLYYAVTAALTIPAGPGLLAGKLAALAGGGLLLGALFGLGRRFGGWLAGLIAALAFFTTPEAGNAFACKPDTLAFGCLLAGALAFEAGRDRPANRLLVLAGTLVAAACLAKQQIWPLAAAFAASLFLYRLTFPQRRAALAGLVAAGALLAVAACAVFGFGLIEQTVLFPKAMTGLAADNSAAAAWARIAAYAAGHAPLLAAYAGWLIVCAARRLLPLPDLLLVAYLPFLGRTLMWSGSDTNHFLYVSAAASLGAASLAGFLASRPGVGRSVAVLALAALIPAGITLHRPTAAIFAPPPAAVAEASAARAALAGVAGAVLMDAEGAYLFAGTPDFARLRLYDAFETDMYDRLGLASITASPMAADIAGRRVVRFVDSQVFISQGLLSWLRLYYEPAGRVGRYALYKPRPETALLAMPVADRVARSDGGWSAVADDARNIRNWGRYLQADDPAAPLVLGYRVTGPAPARSAGVSYCPRLTEPGQRVTVVAEAADGRELARVEHAFDDFPERGEGFDNRSRLEFAPGAEAFVVRFELTGAAQLWLDAVNPLVIGVTEGKNG